LETYVDAKTAARRLNLPVDTIYRLIETGKLPALRFPVRIRLSDLDTVLDRCRVQPGELSHLNQYAGRPDRDVARWLRSKPNGGNAGPRRS
jgi:excisionase family DNA binding protein